MAEKKECPQCGNDTFKIVSEVSRERRFVGYLYENNETEAIEEGPEAPEYETIRKIRCANCYNELALATNM